MRIRLYAMCLATALAVTGLAGCTLSPDTTAAPSDPTTAPPSDPTAAAPAGPGLLVDAPPDPATEPPPTTAATDGATSSPQAPAGAPTTAPPGGETPKPCTPGGLAASFDPGTADAGTRQGTVSVRNTAGVACAIRGYPYLQLVAADGAPLPSSTTPLDELAAEVVLGHGQSAHAVVRWGTNRTALDPAGSSPCQPAAATLLVSVPRSTQTLAVPFTAGPVCDFGRFTVGPFTA